jgi:hypothetical protein
LSVRDIRPTASRGETERPRLAPALPDPVRESGGEQPARIALARKIRGQPETPPVLARRSADQRQSAAIGFRVAVTYRLQPQADVDRNVVHPLGSERIALLQQRREIGRERSLRRRLRREHHRGQPRMRPD